MKQSAGGSPLSGSTEGTTLARRGRSAREDSASIRRALRKYRIRRWVRRGLALSLPLLFGVVIGWVTLPLLPESVRLAIEDMQGTFVEKTEAESNQANRLVPPTTSPLKPSAAQPTVNAIPTVAPPTLTLSPPTVLPQAAQRTVAPSDPSSHTPVSTVIKTPDLGQLRESMLSMINEDRAANGLTPVLL